MRISNQQSPVQFTIDHKQQQNAEYFNYLSSMIKGDTRCTGGIESRISMAEAGFNKKKAFGRKMLDSDRSFVWC